MEKCNQRLTSQVQLVGEIRSLGYDVKSVAADEGPSNSDFDGFIEVKPTIRITSPSLDNHGQIGIVNLTRKEWITTEQSRAAYMVYYVYLTTHKTYIRKIINPSGKNEQGIIYIVPTMYHIDFRANSINDSIEVDNILWVEN